MYEELLVAVDGSDCAATAVDDAFAIAERYDATLYAVSVVEVYGLSTVTERTAREEEADERLADLAERATERGLDCETERRAGFADRELLAAVDEHGVDLVVMGTHGRTGAQRFFVGSVAAQVVRHSPVPVVTTRATDERWSVETVLVATDGSEHAAAAERHGVDVAARFGATVSVVSAVDVAALGADVRSVQFLEAMTERAEAAVERTVASAEEAGVPVSGEVVEGHPHEAILDAADDRSADLVVLGTHGRTMLDRVVIGSVAERVVRGATVPVLTVPNGG